MINTEDIQKVIDDINMTGWKYEPSVKEIHLLKELAKVTMEYLSFILKTDYPL